MNQALSRFEILELNAAESQSIRHKIFDNFYLVVLSEPSSELELPFSYVSIEDILEYNAFCDDFGPMNLESIFCFCNIISDFQEGNMFQFSALLSSADPKRLTNAVFLLGSYMIMERGALPDDVDRCFQPLRGALLAYRDVSPGEPTFALELRDCWAGLRKAKALGWADFGPGGFDPAEYAHLDSPLNADMHEVVPGRIFAMRGPLDLPRGALWRDARDERGGFGHRDFTQ